ncbi:hypothetical protein BLNAU_18688 [Blattamonas nauphoetae]|uniref:Uncharacterized protein n=1 Tax=Blattamonas nauphoetae TaxID=2049346 RepID=A0ABQ9X3S1_9EUKA|nr:hypothetical protein BLNAU_18688 [Blattamonas nauphoetae]
MGPQIAQECSRFACLRRCFATLNRKNRLTARSFSFIPLALSPIQATRTRLSSCSCFPLPFNLSSNRPNLPVLRAIVGVTSVDGTSVGACGKAEEGYSLLPTSLHFGSFALLAHPLSLPPLSFFIPSISSSFPTFCFFRFTVLFHLSVRTGRYPMLLLPFFALPRESELPPAPSSQHIPPCLKHTYSCSHGASESCSQCPVIPSGAGALVGVNPPGRMWLDKSFDFRLRIGRLNHSHLRLGGSKLGTHSCRTRGVDLPRIHARFIYRTHLPSYICFDPSFCVDRFVRFWDDILTISEEIWTQ